MMDYENYDGEKHFYALLDTCIQMARKQLRQNDRDAWSYFYLGASNGYKAFYEAKKGSYLKAFEHATLSLNALNKAGKIDSTLYDVNLGLGSYKYHRSKLSRHLAWLPFVKDDKQEAIRLLRKAVHLSRYSRYGAMNGLCWILLEEGDYAEAKALVDSALARFPHSRVFLWCAAKLAAKTGEWQQAIDYYQQILHSFASEGVRSPYNEVVCRKNLAVLYARQGRFEFAARECGKAHAVSLDRETRKRLRKVFRTLDETCALTSKASF